MTVAEQVLQLLRTTEAVLEGRASAPAPEIGDEFVELDEEGKPIRAAEEKPHQDTRKPARKKAAKKVVARRAAPDQAAGDAQDAGEQETPAASAGAAADPAEAAPAAKAPRKKAAARKPAAKDSSGDKTEE